MANRQLRPADPAERAERLVIAWVTQSAPAPTALADLVAKYRDLVLFVDAAPLQQSLEMSRHQDEIYDFMVKAVADSLGSAS